VKVLHLAQVPQGEEEIIEGCFECSDIIHFITDCPKWKKLDSSNKCNYNNRNDSSDKGEGKKKYHFGDKKKKKFQKMMS
jgi:hypothetical protein